MRRDRHLRVLPQRVFLGQGLDGEDVQHRAGQLAAIQRLEHVLIHHMLAAAAVNQRRAVGQLLQ